MNKKLGEIEVRKLFQEYNFLLVDEEYKNEIIDTERDIFLGKVKEICGDKLNQDQEPPPPTNDINKDKFNLPEVDESTMVRIKKLYREIVKITHPDRTGNKEYIELYIQSTKAMEEYNLFVIYDICNKLDILYSLEDEEKIILKVKIQKKKDKLKNIENSFIWLYFHASNEEEKQKIIQMFIEKHGNKF
jgi:hypothetical protein